MNATRDLAPGELAELRAALREGRVDDAALAPLQEPEWALRIELGDGGGDAWLAGGRLVLHTVAEGGGDRLALLPADLLAGTLAELVDLGPRPHAEGAAPLRVRAGELARAIAEPTGATGPLAPVVRSLRQHWRVDARRATDHRAVEALDTGDGIWLLVPDGAEVELVPVTPTYVFRLFAALTG